MTSTRSLTSSRAFAAFTVVMVALFIGLGVWQLQRRSAKHALIAALTDRVTAAPAPLPPAELIRAINALTSEGGDQYFVEILRKPGKRTPRVAGESDHGDELDFEQD